MGMGEGPRLKLSPRFHCSLTYISRIILFLFSSMDCHQEVCLTTRNEDSKDHKKPCSEIMTILHPRKTCRQPDSLYAYFVCFCGFLSILIAVGCSYSYGLLFPVLLDEFKEGKAKTGKVSYPCLTFALVIVQFLASGGNSRAAGRRDLSQQTKSTETPAKTRYSQSYNKRN